MRMAALLPAREVLLIEFPYFASKTTEQRRASSRPAHAMVDPSSNTGEWPNRGHELVVSASTMATLATVVAGWRLAVRFRMSPWMGLSDWLMLGGVVRCIEPSLQAQRLEMLNV